MNNQIQSGIVLYDYSLKEYKISKVGNKYFEVENVRGRFYKDTLKFDTQYSNKIQLYFDKYYIINDKECRVLEDKIRSQFGAYGKTKLTLYQLKRIWKTIEPKTTNEYIST